MDQQLSRCVDLQHVESVGVCDFVVAAVAEEGCTEVAGGLCPAVGRGDEDARVDEHH